MTTTSMHHTTRNERATAGPDLLVVAVDTDGVRAESALRDLLPRAPHRFTPKTAPDRSSSP